MQTQTDPSGVEKKGRDWKHSGGKSEKKGGVVLSVPKVLLHRPTREYSLDNRMLYRVWCGCFGQKVIVKDLTKILQHQADRHH
ncbi:hypothetical protein [Candidatus Williamhamiltonella defendens]|uniref:hypothetical protein n=1 Tax=Candidatus Williamhamiltonella defendens TaxID=138072 RepID=UPI0018746209|nr:hypothetical protein [Candidatus Hamiltonella defensa]